MAKKKEELAPTKKDCLKCRKTKRFKEDFYLSNSPNHGDGKYPVCKNCCIESLTLEDDLMSSKSIQSMKTVLLEMNRPFLYFIYESSIEEATKANKQIFGIYVKNIGMRQYRDLTWVDSEFETSPSSSIDIIDSPNVEIQDSVIVSNRDKDDVLKMLGYDPFEYESKYDKKYLYSKLIDFLDESTLEDGFKLQAVIEIVKGFNQIDKINQAITNITGDIGKLSTNSGGIKSLIDSKKNILASLIKLAEDNGLSVKHNNQKSKGAGTLSGIIKTLNEKGITAGEINIFDIETCDGMKQVADISNRSIMEQLMLNENDYSEMIKDQRDLILNYESKLAKLEEENRLIKIKLKYLEEKKSE